MRTKQSGLFELDDPGDDDVVEVVPGARVGPAMTRDEWVSRMDVAKDVDSLYETATIRKVGAGYTVAFTRESGGKVLTFSGMTLSPRQFKLLVESIRKLLTDAKRP